MVTGLVIGLVAGAVAGLAVAVVVGLARRRAQPEPPIGAAERQLGAELQRMGALVAQLQRAQDRSHGDLAAGIREALRVTRELGTTTRDLQAALGNSQARGQWGERMADDVLRAAGLVEGVSYVRQRGLADGTRPDVTFLLPEGRVLHMDVKFPADHYLAALHASSEAEQSDHERAFLRAVRGHLKTIAGRGYADPSTTPGIALVFIPNEAIYSFVMSADPDLVDVALGLRLVVCSPFTLFAVLAVVRQSTEAFRIGQASDELRDGLTRFRSEWTRFAGQLDRVAKQWETAHRGFEELAGTRRRQLERQLERVDQLSTDTSASERLSLVASVVESPTETQVSEVGGAR